VVLLGILIGPSLERRPIGLRRDGGMRGVLGVGEEGCEHAKLHAMAWRNFAQKPIALQVLSSRNSDEYSPQLHKMREITDTAAHQFRFNGCALEEAS